MIVLLARHVIDPLTNAVDVAFDWAIHGDVVIGNFDRMPFAAAPS